MVADTGADEVIVVTMVHGHAPRLRSYELLANEFGLRDAAALRAPVGAVAE